MGYSWNTLHALPRLRSYEDALAHYHYVKPVRGDEEQRRPLGLRRMKYIHIKLEANSDVCIYNGGWDNDPLLTYRPNGDVLIHMSEKWVHTSENELLDRVLGLHAETFQNRVWVTANGSKHYLRARPKRIYDRNKNTWVYPEGVTMPENVFRWSNEGTPYGRWVYVNPPTITRHAINRSASRAIKRSYAEGIAYVRALTKLRRDDPPSPQEIAQAFADMGAPQFDPNQPWNYIHNLRHHLPDPKNYAFRTHHAATFCKLLGGSTEDQLKVYLWLAFACSRTSTGPEHMLDQMLWVHHRDAVFVEVEEITTKPVRDNYAWVFRVLDE